MRVRVLPELGMSQKFNESSCYVSQCFLIRVLNTRNWILRLFNWFYPPVDDNYSLTGSSLWLELRWVFCAGVLHYLSWTPLSPYCPSIVYSQRKDNIWGAGIHLSLKIVGISIMLFIICETGQVMLGVEKWGRVPIEILHRAFCLECECCEIVLFLVLRRLVN